MFCVNHPFQLALARSVERWVDLQRLASILSKQRRLFRNLISTSRFEIEPCTGTYFQLLNYKNITDEKDTDFAIRLTRRRKKA